MSWTGAIVMFAMFFFVVLFVLLPRGLQTQQDSGEVVKGTPRSAPAQINIGRKFLWSAIISALIVGAVALVLELKLFTLDDFSFMTPAPINAE